MITSLGSPGLSSALGPTQLPGAPRGPDQYFPVSGQNPCISVDTLLLPFLPQTWLGKGVRRGSWTEGRSTETEP